MIKELQIIYSKQIMYMSDKNIKGQEIITQK
jgi:hypothetical protein